MYGINGNKSNEHQNPIRPHIDKTESWFSIELYFCWGPLWEYVTFWEDGIIPKSAKQLSRKPLLRERTSCRTPENHAIDEVSRQCRMLLTKMLVLNHSVEFADNWLWIFGDWCWGSGTDPTWWFLQTAIKHRGTTTNFCLRNLMSDLHHPRIIALWAILISTALLVILSMFVTSRLKV